MLEVAEGSIVPVESAVEEAAPCVLEAGKLPVLSFTQSSLAAPPHYAAAELSQPVLTTCGFTSTTQASEVQGQISSLQQEVIQLQHQIYQQSSRIHQQQQQMG